MGMVQVVLFFFKLLAASAARKEYIAAVVTFIGSQLLQKQYGCICKVIPILTDCFSSLMFGFLYGQVQFMKSSYRFFFQLNQLRLSVLFFYLKSS